MYEPLSFERQDYCPNCNTKRSLMIVDEYGNIINYPIMLDKDDHKIYSHAKSKTYLLLRCDHCGKEFFIDWSQGELPRPMPMNFYLSFMRNFKFTKKF